MVDDATHLTPQTALEVKLPCEIAGRIEKKHERNWYTFLAKKGEVYAFELLSQRLGEPADMKFVIRNARNQQTLFEAQDNNDQTSSKFFTRTSDPPVYRFSTGGWKVRSAGEKLDRRCELFGPRQFYRLRIAGAARFSARDHAARFRSAR